MSKEMVEKREANQFSFFNIRKILCVFVKIPRYIGFEMSKNCPNM